MVIQRILVHRAKYFHTKGSSSSSIVFIQIQRKWTYLENMDLHWKNYTQHSPLWINAMKWKLTLNSFADGLIIVAKHDSIPWLWITAPALRIWYAWIGRRKKKCQILISKPLHKQESKSRKWSTRMKSVNLHYQCNPVQLMKKIYFVICHMVEILGQETQSY